MKARKSSGARTVPCGTLEMTSACWDLLPSSITLLSMTKECFYPFKGISVDSIEAELIQKPLMRYFIKGFCKVQKDNIHLGPVVQSFVSLTSSLRVISLTVLVD